MNAYLVIGLVGLAIVCAVFAWSACAINKTPAVKTHDAIDEEIRRERLELHNTACVYGEIQRSEIRVNVQHNEPLDDAAQAIERMLVAAFREGAKWQQRRP